ncbi:YfhO family protein [Faecalispora anaeroviscerum]|uniref:YfhO family protein n=1 Tax=Faecalispora anaeroviscerum TaxID=2991836 RepID=UPI0024BBE78A|nr:YfhO family protein [Faecalispora anaeroviscerum]
MKRRCWPAPIATAGLTLLLFFLFHLYPFENQTLAWCDMKQQVIPFLLDFQNILNGNADFLLNTQNAGGMSFLGVFFFFVSSPFTFLVLLVPAEQMYLFANILVLLKMALCSLTAAIFFRHRFSSLNTTQLLALSIMYAFGGYTMLYFQNMVWLDVMAMFPILMIGLDRLIRQHRPLCYTLSLAAIMVLNFYLTYMVVIFVVLAFGIYLRLTQERTEERKQSVLLLGISTVCALLVTGAVWLPSLFQYLSSARAVGLIESISSGSFFTSFYTTLPILLCSSGVIAALAFLNPVKCWRDSHIRSLLILWVLLTVPLFIEPINKMWHTGSYQAFPARYGYMTALLGLLFLAKAISDLNQEEGRFLHQGWPGIGIGVFLLACMSLVAYLLLYYRYRDLSIYTRTLWLDETAVFYFLLFTILAILCYYLVLYLYRHQYLTKRYFSLFLLLLACCESLFSGSVFIGSAANPVSFYSSVFDLKDKIHDTSMYRVKNGHKYFDVNLLGGINYPTLNHYTSLTDEDFMFTMKRMGYSSYWMEVSSHDGTELTDALWGNRYTVKREYETTHRDNVIYQNDRYALVKNKELLSFGTVIQSGNISELKDLPNMTRRGIQQYLFTKVFGSEEQLTEEYESSSATNLFMYDTGSQMELLRENSEKDGVLEYHILVEGTQTLYLDCFDQVTNHLTEPAYKSLRVSVNDETVAYQYPTQQENGLLNLGTFTDQAVDIRVTVLRDFHAKSFGIFGMNLETLDTAAASAPKVQLTQNGNCISGTVQASGENPYLLLPLSYQKGYSVQVNGKAAEAYQVFGDMMAIPLEQGENKVQLTFVPQGLKLGILLSAFGIFTLVGFWILLKREGYHFLRPMEPLALWAYRILFFVILTGIYLFPLVVYAFG